MLHHRIVGKSSGGRMCVLLHGLLGSGKNLTTLARAWVERDTNLGILLADLTGHGDSPPLPTQPTLVHVAADVVALVEHLGMPQVDVVGHSFGGRVALVARLQAPDKIGQLTLLDVSAGPMQGRSAAGEQKVEQKVVPGRLAKVLELFAGAPEAAQTRGEMKEYFVRGGLPSTLADWLLMNLRRDAQDGVLRWKIERHRLLELSESQWGVDLWSAVDAHTYCIRGALSSFVSDEDAARMRAMGAQVHTLEGAGHFLHVDRLHELVNMLLA